ncbi:unnamed protein product [Didymodactylos carnosus]|uniref:F-box domain-containing protein n=1 Tax=Didymodactylos carnosus TaxID=1234261 RepID=A0A8S2DGK3_9BILA|nr:unnamed protein product [Didymodactylos carnosus]CAF3734410.1 unnamed protein product [Didymodactylos carnosus]
MSIITDLSKIEIILQKLDHSSVSHQKAILIGSRAARRYLPHFRDVYDQPHADWDLILSANLLLQWLKQQQINIQTTTMIIPLLNELDLSVNCTLNNKQIFDFLIPRSSTSYSTFLLEHITEWSYEISSYIGCHCCIPIAIAHSRLLLILKRYMLYYQHQWNKTANDYRQLLEIKQNECQLNVDLEQIFIKLFINNNEILHGKRPADIDQFSFSVDVFSHDIRMKLNEQSTLTRNDFFTLLLKDEQILFVYQLAVASSSSDNDILIGLEKICTKYPLWLADFTIDNWLDIYNIYVFYRKYKQNILLPLTSIQVTLENQRLFQELPELVMYNILSFITDTTDFHSLKLVCKHWYTILKQDSFWKELYLFRFGSKGQFSQYSQISRWKLLYFWKLECDNLSSFDNEDEILKLIDTTMQLRKIKANSVVELWENLTKQNQFIEPLILSQIQYILLNSYYYYLNEDILESPNKYTAKLIVIGLENSRSRTQMLITLLVGDYGSSRFEMHREQISIECDSDKIQTLTFDGPRLYDYSWGTYGYVRLSGDALLSIEPNQINQYLPSGICISLLSTMVHPARRERFIQYLITTESHCSSSLCALCDDMCY